MERLDGPLVVGAGPVGLTAAWALARQGVAVTVVEAAAAVGTESRASTFHAPTLEMLAALDVAEELVARGLVAPTYQFRDRDRGVIAELDMSVLADVTPYPFRLQCQQTVLAEILARRLGDDARADLRFAAPVDRVEQVADGVVAHLVSGATLHAPWVIGADGAHSRVRGAAGIGFPGLTFPERYLVVSTTYDFREAFPDIAYVNYVSDPERWYVLLANPEGWRALFPVPLDAPDAEVTRPEQVQGLMRDVVDLGRAFPVDHVTLYKVHQRVADRFRAGRILLAGDAAHINNPLGGMGMNSGIHDAVALAAALGPVVLGGGTGGAAGDAAVETYARRRRQVAIEYVGADTSRNWSALREADPGARERQHREWREMAADRDRLRAYLLRASMLESVRSAA